MSDMMCVISKNIEGAQRPRLFLPAEKSCLYIILFYQNIGISKRGAIEIKNQDFVDQGITVNKKSDQ